jgi:predicted dienelactone hydrolase
MRIFEIILLSTSTIFLFLMATRSYGLTKRIPLLFFSSVLLAHFLLEGYRWQMVPTYLIIVILSWCLFKEYQFFKGNWFKKSMYAVSLIIILPIAWGLPYALPAFNLPKPTGKYKAGSQYLYLKTNQDEIITPKTADKRALMIKVWYPASLNNEKTEPYLNDGDRAGFAKKYRLPASVFNYLDYVKTHTFINPSIAKGKFPVLIFSHGYYSNASGYYALIEEIVSHGYIVMNINHTYESTGALFPNGEIKLYSTAYDKEHNNKEMAEMTWNAIQNYKKATNSNEQYTAIENLIHNYIATEITLRWSKDISLVVDELEKWNKSTFLAKHIDTSKIGVFGHSQGGAAAGQALLDDKRIKAGINIDGVQWGAMLDTVLTKPFLLISSEWDSSNPNFNKLIYHKGNTSAFYKAKILHSRHSNFMDIPLMIKLPFLNEAGTINPNKAFEITTAITLQFFDKYLSGKPSDLLQLASKYPELEVIRFE